MNCPYYNIGIALAYKEVMVRLLIDQRCKEHKNRCYENEPTNKTNSLSRWDRS